MKFKSRFTNKKLVLIVDDEKIHRHILNKFLTNIGYNVLEASNGLEGVNLFMEHSPDLVFMDIMMPVMDGFEAANIIKRSQLGRFVPIIFLTALDTPSILRRCIEVGGDDFLTKPINVNTIKIRMMALERTSDLYNQLYLQHKELMMHINSENDNKAIALNIIQNAILPRNITLDAIKYVIKPASTFSGDIFLCGPVSDGNFRLMLGDFTGHGLASAMVLIPVSEAFHTMRLKGKSQIETLNEINQKLCQLLPEDRFMAATIIDFCTSTKQITIWSGGMPDLFISDKNTLTNLKLKGLPLGILENYPFINDQIILDRNTKDRILLFSDGLLELRNDKKELFLHSKNYHEFLNNWKKNSMDIKDMLDLSVDLHSQGRQQDDDISLAEINLRHL